MTSALRTAAGGTGSTSPSLAGSSVAHVSKEIKEEPEEDEEQQGGEEQQQEQEQQQLQKRPARARRRRRTHRAPAPRLNVAAEISRLEQLVAQHRATVDNLMRMQHTAAARAHAAHIAVSQCIALLKLDALLSGKGQRPGAAAAGEHHLCNGDGDDRGGGGGPGGSSEDSRAWLVQLEGMAQLLEAAGAVPQPDAAGLGWSPEAAAAMALSGEADTSLEGLRRAIREFTQRTGHLYLKARPGSGCPDAAFAMRRLAEERERLMNLVALIVVAAADPSPCSQILLSPMDGGEEERQGGGSGLAPRSVEWMVWLVEQLQLDADQEEIMDAALAGLNQINAPGMEHRSELLRQCATVARHDAVTLNQLAATISAGLRTYQHFAGVYALAIYGAVLRADQLAGLMISSWPHCPALSGLRAARQVITARRQAAAEAAAEAQARGEQEHAETAVAVGSDGAGTAAAADEGEEEGFDDMSE